MSFVVQYMHLDDVCDFLRENRQKRFLITFHSMGDRDGVGSAFALSRYLTKSTVVTPDFITRNAREMLTQIGYADKIPSAFIENTDAIILDTNSPESMGPFRDKLTQTNMALLFIDHHLLPKEKLQNAIFFNDESYNSTASMVYEILKKLGFKVDKNTAIALLNGIISDSAEFHNATSLTFRQVSELLDTASLKYAEVMKVFNQNIPVENRASLFEDIRASKSEVVGGYLILSGRSTTHANLVADTAIKLGADAAVFWKESEREASISARLRPPLDQKLSIHLGRMMQGISATLNGNGGGHPCAAGAYGPNKENAIKSVEKILNELRTRFRGG